MHGLDGPTCSSRSLAREEGLPAIEEAIFAGVPVNVTLLFSREHYVAAADAYMRGIERRIAAGLNPNVRSVASVFISRWDKAVMDKTPHELRDQLGIAVAKRTYRAYRGLLDSNRFQRLANAGARAQRLLWASTGTKDPEASDILYVTSLAAPNTVNTMPEATLLAFANHGEIGPLLTADDNAEEMLAGFEPGRHRCRRTGVRPPARRRHSLRRFLERADGWHRVQERDVEESRLIFCVGRRHDDR